jgi:hypothetical protein
MSWRPQPRPEISRQKLREEFWRGFNAGYYVGAIVVTAIIIVVFSMG